MIIAAVKLEDSFTPDEYVKEYDIRMNELYPTIPAWPGLKPNPTLQHHVPIYVTLGECNTAFRNPATAERVEKKRLPSCDRHVFTEVLPWPLPFLM